MRPALLCVLIAVASAGCSPGGFSQLGDFQIRFLDNSGFVMADLFYDPQLVGGCKTLGQDATATVNGERVSFFAGDAVTSFIPPRTDCRFPELQFDRPGLIGEAVTLVATSGDEEMDVDIEGLGANLPGTLVLGQGAAVHAGDLIHIELGAGFERVNWSQVIGSHVTDSPTGQVHMFSVSPPSAMGVLDVQLPGDLPAGHATLRVFARANVRFTRCQGPAACSWDPGLLPTVALQVAFDVAP